MAVRDLRKRAAETGHAWRTVQLAKAGLGATATRSGFAVNGAGEWALSDARGAAPRNGGTA
jgi:hypothetical protein